MRWPDFLCASDRIFPMGGNPYFLSNFPASMYFHEVVHFSIHGPEICPRNLGGNVKFLPPQKFHQFTRKFRGPEIPPPGPEFPPPAVSLYKEGAGVKIPLGIFFLPRPPLSKPPPPPPQGLLRRLPSRRNLRISPVRALLSVGVPFLYAVFTMDDGIASNLSS
jgi:hypothetical protein